MITIICPECKRKISDKVKNCPHCGYELENNKVTEEQQTNNSIEIKNNIEPIKTKKKPIKPILIFSFIIILIIAICACFIRQEKKLDINTINDLQDMQSAMEKGVETAQKLYMSKSFYDYSVEDILLNFADKVEDIKYCRETAKKYMDKYSNKLKGEILDTLEDAYSYFKEVTDFVDTKFFIEDDYDKIRGFSLSNGLLDILIRENLE